MLLLTVVNPADRRGYVPGSGLVDLAGRLRQAGGVLGHQQSGGLFRVHAVLPAAPAPRRSGVNGVGLAAGILLGVR